MKTLLCTKCKQSLLVIAIEEYPEHLSPQERLRYSRVCDAQCPSCGKIYHSQPYDDGLSLNSVRRTKKI